MYKAKSAPQDLRNLKHVIEFEHSITAAGALVVLTLNLVRPERKFDTAVLVLNAQNGWRCIMCANSITCLRFRVGRFCARNGSVTPETKGPCEANAGYTPREIVC